MAGQGSSGKGAAVEPFVVADVVAWRAWLDEHEGVHDGVWLVLAKKGTVSPTSLTYDQALDEALCSGWIDGQKRSHDAATFLQRFTPRRARSMWSQRNVEHVARLVAEGRMRPRGQGEVDRARADGRWDRAYAGSATIEVPADLAAALAAVPGATEAFAALGSQGRYSLLHPVVTAATPATRARRVDRAVAAVTTGALPSGDADSWRPTSPGRGGGRRSDGRTGRPRDEGDDMAQQVEVPTRSLAAVRATVPMTELVTFFDAAYSTVERTARTEGWTIAGPAVGWFPTSMPTGPTEVTAGFAVDGVPSGASSGDVTVLELPGGPALVATHHGSYDGLPGAWERLEQERAALGVDGRGDFWEEYVSEPSPGGDPSGNVTRLVLPLRTRS